MEGAVTTGAPGAGTDASGVAGSGAQVSSGWTAGLSNPDLRGWADNKGFKDVSTALESHRNLERLLGTDKADLLRFPKDKADKDGWKAIHSRLGVPEDKKGYALKAAEGSDFADTFSDWAHQNNLTKEQAEGVYAKIHEYAGKGTQQAAEGKEAAFNRDESALKSEWGKDYDAKFASAKRAINSAGIGEEALNKLENTLGWGESVKLLSALGAKMGEDSFEGAGNKGGNGGANSSSASAQARIAELQNDKGFVQRLMNGDADAAREWSNLQDVAYKPM